MEKDSPGNGMRALAGCYAAYLVLGKVQWCVSMQLYQQRLMAARLQGFSVGKTADVLWVAVQGRAVGSSKAKAVAVFLFSIFFALRRKF